MSGYKEDPPEKRWCELRNLQSVSVSHACPSVSRIELLNIDFQRPGEEPYFFISHSPNLSLDLGQGATTDGPFEDVAASRERLLGHALRFSNLPHLGSDNVQFLAPNSELDFRRRQCHDCSVFGATTNVLGSFGKSISSARSG